MNNNFKLLTETKTIITSWAVPQDAVLEDMSTGILFDYCLDQVCQNGNKVDVSKVQVEYKKTLELQELDTEDIYFYPPPPKPLDVVIETADTLLIKKEDSTEEDIVETLENLELLKQWVEMRMAELTDNRG
jgi:hypothetical protein